MSEELDFVRELLAALVSRGPLTSSELAVELNVPEDALEEELHSRGDVAETVDGWAAVAVLAEGSVLTHVVSEREVSTGVLAGDGDLALWASLAEEPVPLAGGGHVQTRYGPVAPEGSMSALVGPDGWLDGVRAGDVVGVRLTGGALSVEAVEPLPDPVPERIALLVQTAHDITARAGSDDDEADGVLLDDLLLAALDADPQVLAAPLPPLTVLLRLSGLDVEGNVASIAGSEGLTAEQRMLLAVLRSTLMMAGQSTGQGMERELPEAPDLLADDPAVLQALAADLAVDPDLRAGLPALTDGARTPCGRGVAAYLRAVAEDAEGRVERAEQLLTEALKHHPRLEPALRQAGHLAAERSDAFTADELYRKAGDDVRAPWRAPLREFLAPVPGRPGRNRPCPCGSGRKAKACCGTAGSVPLPQRANWRLTRALMFSLLSPDELRGLLNLVLAVPGGGSDELDVLAADLALFEGGRLEEYLTRRGALMPADERALVEQWCGTPRQLLEVTSVRPARGLTVRALPDGDPQDLPNRTLSAHVERLDLLLARLLDDGQSRALLTPPVPVPRPRRQGVLAALEDGNPLTIALSVAPTGPPTLLTREHEPMVFCTARYAVENVDSAMRTLATQLVDDDEGGLIELFQLADGDEVIRGSVRRVDGGVEIQCRGAAEQAGRTRGGGGAVGQTGRGDAGTGG